MIHSTVLKLDLFCAEGARYRSFEENLFNNDTLAKKENLLPQVGVVDATQSKKQYVLQPVSEP